MGQLPIVQLNLGLSMMAMMCDAAHRWRSARAGGLLRDV